MRTSHLPSDDPEIHLYLQEISSSEQNLLDELRAQLESSCPLSCNHRDFLDDRQLLRFLIARKFDFNTTIDMIQGALEWRETRKVEELATPQGFQFLSKEGKYLHDEFFMSSQVHTVKKKISIQIIFVITLFEITAETGKCYVAGSDRWKRPLLVLNGSVQNTPHCDDHMLLLAWSLELMIMMMPKDIERYTVFMNLEDFSFFNMPSMAESIESIKMLTQCYPERLGHCVVYLPPFVFKAFYDSLSFMIDAKTLQKVVFLYGDVDDDSDNDRIMKEIIGNDWKKLTGATMPVLKPGHSPGYDHRLHFSKMLSNYEKLSGKNVLGHSMLLKQTSVAKGTTKKFNANTMEMWGILLIFVLLNLDLYFVGKHGVVSSAWEKLQKEATPLFEVHNAWSESLYMWLEMAKYGGRVYSSPLK